MQPDKIIYLVRHGESEGNAKRIYQPPDSPLSKKGKKQAEIIAKRLKNLEFDVLISSSSKRAIQTAEIVAREKNIEFELTDLFVEVRKPSKAFGRKIGEEEILDVIEKWKKAFLTSGEKFEDGESFDEVIERSDKALDFLRKREEKRIMVITHGLFLRVLLARAIFDKDLTGKILYDFWISTATDNTGITVLELYFDNPQIPYLLKRLFKKKRYKWLLRTFNDQAHLR